MKLEHNSPRIKDVWEDNFVHEMAQISKLVRKYKFVALDTEFPGTVARPVGRVGPDYNYQTMRVNVNMLKLIQIGVSLCDENGRCPEEYSTWQFNLKFDIAEDLYAADSILFLEDNGMSFHGRKRKGISLEQFAVEITASGLVIMDDIRWISFQGGYDFGYLLKLISGEELPSSEREFFENLALFFPNFWDVKFLMELTEHLSGGLDAVAQMLGVERFGQKHQAGSDALLTLHVFFRLQKNFFRGRISDGKMNILHGYGVASHVRCVRAG